MMSAVYSEEVAQELVAMLRRGKCVAWIGSGLSVPERYPGWRELVERLCTACNVRRPSAVKTFEASKLLALAQRCKNVNTAKYEQTLAEVFGRPVRTDPRAYTMLAKLPFKGYVTTNYDPLLRDAVCARDGQFCQYPALVAPLVERPHPVAFYVHGLARDEHDHPCGQNLVLAESEFQEAYKPDGATAIFIKYILNYYDIFFVGCRLEEPDIQESLARICRLHKGILVARPKFSPTQRLMLLPRTLKTEQIDGASSQTYDQPTEQKDDATYKELGIRIVRYETTGAEDHVDVDEMLRQALRIAGIDRPVGPILNL